MKIVLPQVTPLVVDNSILRATATCSTKSMIEMVLGLQASEEVPALMSGRAAHEALAAWLISEGDDKVGLRAFDKAYQAWSEINVPSGDRLSWQNTRKILQAWFRRTPYRELPYVVKQVEVGFRVPLAPQIDFVGLLDAVAVSVSGEPVVVEHKTTKTLTDYWIAKWLVDSQITGYDWGASQQLGEPITMTYINGIEFRKLNTSDKICRGGKDQEAHGVPYSECAPLHCRAAVISVQRTNEQVRVWQVDAIRLAKRYRKLVERAYRQLCEYVPVTDSTHDVDAEWSEVQPIIQSCAQEGTFTAACQFCSFAEFCKTGRRHRGMLVSRPWDPAGHAKLRPLEVGSA